MTIPQSYDRTRLPISPSCAAIAMTGRPEHGVEFMGPAEIARIADDEPVFEAPFATQGIVATGNRANCLVVAPVRDDLDARRREAARAEPFGHAVADHDIDLGGVQR